MTDIVAVMQTSKINNEIVKTFNDEDYTRQSIYDIIV